MNVTSRGHTRPLVHQNGAPALARWSAFRNVDVILAALPEADHECWRPHIESCSLTAASCDHPAHLSNDDRAYLTWLAAQTRAVQTVEIRDLGELVGWQIRCRTNDAVLNDLVRTEVPEVARWRSPGGAWVVRGEPYARVVVSKAQALGYHVEGLPAEKRHRRHVQRPVADVARITERRGETA